jgi:hypothetical protein
MARGRQSREVEFLRTLRGLMGLNQADFANACGKKPSNMHRYLAGQLQPGKKALGKRPGQAVLTKRRECRCPRNRDVDTYEIGS